VAAELRAPPLVVRPSGTTLVFGEHLESRLGIFEFQPGHEVSKIQWMMDREFNRPTTKSVAR
jgi:hypothetical protein